MSQKLSDLGNFEYANVINTSFRCTDGRITDLMLGAPGGDAGLFILALQVYEDLSGRELD